MSPKKSQLTLALSASTKTASVAITDGKATHFLENPVPRKHSEFLNLALAQLLTTAGADISDISEIRLDRGPGSFTGERAAVSFAKTLAYSLQIPIRATTSLDVLLVQSPAPSLAVLDAHRNLFYSQLSIDLARTPRLLKLEDLEKVILGQPEALHCAGDCNEVLQAGLSAKAQAQLHFGGSVSTFPKAETLLQTNGLNFEIFDWNSLFPLYIRLSSAEEVLHERSRNT